MTACQLYVLTPPHIDDIAAFAAQFAEISKAASIACLQLRLKSAPRQHIIETAKALQPICRAHGTTFLINDDPEIANEIGADGVHLGQSDMNINLAKTLLPEDAIIGITCHNSKHLAFTACEAGASYVAFGAFFTGETKPEAPPADLEILRWWHQAIEIPSVAIGGINASNCKEVITAGADYIAVSGAIWNAVDPAGAAKALSQKCAEFSPPPLG